MMYGAFEFQMRASEPFRAAAQMALALFGPTLAATGTSFGRTLNATWEMMTRTEFTHVRPPYGIDTVVSGNREVAVTEVPVHRTPFGTLLHFKKDMAQSQPKVLLVAPLSGHFATLLRNTARTLLQDHEVYITDWHNARDVPVSAGRFGFDEYIEHLIEFLHVLGPGAHVVAVCQPCVQALAATAVMAEDRDPAAPHTLTLMAGPIDVRINPTKVNELAFEHPYEWFEEKLISKVPLPYAGVGRAVYPGFLQVNAFMQMNMERHLKAHMHLHRHLSKGETAEAEAIKAFYDEYFAVLDLTAEFYLETIDKVFQRALLPQGLLTYKDRPVRPEAITRTALLTVEGERDDICALGQTVAAHDLVTKLKPFRKRHHMQAGVGHYGVFSGRRWEGQVYPIIRNMILANK